MLGQRRNRDETGHLGSLPRPSQKEGAAIIDSSKNVSTGFAKVLFGPPKRTTRGTPNLSSVLPLAVNGIVYLSNASSPVTTISFTKLLMKD